MSGVNGVRIASAIGLVLLMVVAWLVANVFYFHSFQFWTVPREHQVHLLTVTVLVAIAALYTSGIRGPLEDKVQQAFVATTFIFGGYALWILFGRQFFSRAILATILPLSVLINLLVVWASSRRKGTRIGLIEPLAGAEPIDTRGLRIVRHPDEDFRNLDIVLVSLSEPVSGEWSKALSRALLCGCKIQHVGDFSAERDGAVAVDHFELEHLPSGGLGSYVQWKRVIDVVAALLLAPLVLPFIALGALAVLIQSGRPAFFVQDRTGMGGEPFRMWKLRTMRDQTPEEMGKAAVHGDARVTNIGRFLRRTRIDELPQLWNVLRGDMSLIGPRPETAELHAAYVEAYPKFHFRCLVRPGITGWAQVNAPPSATAEEAMVKLKYDLYYVRHQSLFLDALIALRTLWTVTHGSGVR